MSSVLRGRKLLFVVTEDWYFVSHRLAVARAARDAGMEVHVATQVAQFGDVLRAEGFSVHPLRWRRGARAQSLMAALSIRLLIRRIRPDIVHAVALQAVVIGGIAAMGSSAKLILAITGLGYVFTSRSAVSRILRSGLRAIFRIALDRPEATLIMQNDDDRATLVDGGFLKRAAICTIFGSGVDVRHFRSLPEPEEAPVVVAVVARMIAIKGIADLVAAALLVRGRGTDLQLLLVGAPDIGNPSAICTEQLEEWGRQPGIKWLGAVADVREVWAKAHIAALTSLGGEGLPKALLEAAACGRPIIATDVAGSREIAVHEETALLARPGDVCGIADAIERLVCDGALRKRLGQAARGRAERSFASDLIVAQTLNVYVEVLGGE